MTNRSVALLFAILLLLGPAAVRGQQDANGAASQIQRALKTGDVRASQIALNVWENYKEDIVGQFDCAIRVGMAFAKFGALPAVRGYDVIPKECADAAMECAEGADKNAVNPSAKVQTGRLYMETGNTYILAGVGDKGDECLKKAREYLEAAAGGDGASAEVAMDLGRLYGKLAERDPKHAEELIAKATETFEKVRESAGDSAALCLRTGELRVQLAELKEMALEKDPKDRKLKKAVKKLYEEAMECFADGLEISDKDPDLKTAYNETNWIYRALNKGKSKHKPLMVEHLTKYKKIKLELPDSEMWRVVPRAEAKDEDEMFHAFKYNRKEGQALTIFVDQYKWDTNYVNPETGDTVGGDNIGGLARRSERRLKEYFTDIKDRRPLGKIYFSRRIPKAQGYIVKGKTEKGDLLEWQAIFFKHSKVQKTFRVIVIADLGMLDRNPYELKEILSSFELRGN